MRDRAEAQTLLFGHYEQDYTETETSHHTQSLNLAPKSLTDSGAFFRID